MQLTQLTSCCSARNVALVVIVYTTVMAYVIYDYYFTGVDLSHILGNDHAGAEEIVDDQLQKSTKTDLKYVSTSTTRVFDSKANQTSTSTPVRAVTEGLLSRKIEVFGKAESGKKYAVFGCTTPTNDYQYAFYLPLSVLAWQRVNFKSIVILIGKKKQWVADRVLSVILQELESLGAVTIFIHSKPEQAIMLSQVSRVFVPLLVPWEISKDSKDEPYLVTSDADIWPLSYTLYDLMPGTKIVSSNSECCGSFNHKGTVYKMLPMCYIGMHFSTWSEVMNFPPRDPHQTLKNAQFIIDYLEKEFGDLVKSKVTKGENKGWYLDQHLISIRIQQWAATHPNVIQYIRRDTGRDRVDRVNWDSHDITNKRDSHLLLSGYKPGTWERIMPLISQMYPANLTTKAVKYRDTFLKTLYNHDPGS